MKLNVNDYISQQGTIFATKSKNRVFAEIAKLTTKSATKIWIMRDIVLYSELVRETEVSYTNLYFVSQIWKINKKKAERTAALAKKLLQFLLLAY